MMGADRAMLARAKHVYTAAHTRPNKPVELTGHSVGFFPFVGVIACGQQLTGGVRRMRMV